MKIAPSILSADFANLQRDVQLVENAGADLLHVDIMDGHFVPNLSFGPGIVSALRPITNLPLDVHLMVSDPEFWIPLFARAGADTLLVHVEATPHIMRAIQQMHAQGVKAGVVLNPGTPLSALEELLPMLDQVLIMTVNPGFGGQHFIPAMADKVARLAKAREALGLHFAIEVDGGINAKTGKIVLDAGADIAVAGSYVYNGDPEAQLATLQALR